MDEFAESFQQDQSRIAEDIRHLEQSQVSETQVAINQLSDRVRDAGSDIPAHDRKIYGERIKSLQQSLKDRQAAIAPKKKFSFASKGSGFARNKEPLVNVSHDQLEKPSLPQNHPLRDGNIITYADLTDVRIRLDHKSERAARPCNLSSLSSCIADMRDQRNSSASFASLTAKGVNYSIIVCDRVDGPVHLTDVRNSMIVLSARQFRMHKSHNSDVYLQTSSRPIIEDCSGIRFTQLPEFLQRYSEDQTDNQLTEVDDFNWHHSEPSPNWRLLDHSEAISSERWQVILEDKNITAKDVFESMKSGAEAGVEKTVT